MSSASNAAIKIILVEDFHAESETILRELRDAELYFEHQVARSESELETVLGEFAADVILCPYSLKGTNAIKLLDLVRKTDVEVPFILLAFDLSEDIAIDLLAEGVEDYILRSTIKRLPVAIRKALQRHKIQLELKISEAQLRSSEASLNEAQKIAKVGSWEWDIGTDHVWWSEEMYRIYETEKGPITIADVKSFIHPEDLEYVNELTTRDLTEKIEPVIEYRVLLRSGKVKHVISSAKQVLNADGVITRLIGTLQDVTEKVEAELQAKAEQIQRELTLQESQIGVWHWLIKENTLNWDDRCFEIYGLERRELTPQDFLDLLYPEDRNSIQSRIMEALRSGDYSSEYRVKTEDGIKYLHGRGRVTFDEDGNPERMDGIIIDMTERHDMEVALRNSEQLFRDMAESIREVFWLTDWKLNEVLYVSPQYETLYGLSVESLYKDSRSWSSAIHPDDLERATREFRENAIQGTYDSEYRLRMKDGSVKWVRDRAFPVYGTDGRVSRIAGITEDITSRRLDKERIETLSLVASETINGVLIHEPDGTTIWANKGFERITGYSSEEIIGKEPWSVVAGPNTNQRLVEMTYEKLKAGKSFTSDNQLRQKNGNSIWVNISYTPILDEYGNVTKVVSIGMDISKQKETERLQREMLKKLEKANEELKKRASN
ncbi:MAG: PAS domain-containing protein [Flavobacteriales bacterium]|nr:PAS domain-containing protein [Flavobacteriales bacterium]